MTTTQTTRAASHCAECDARLAHDQRYCVECGARRGPLPVHVSRLIGAIHEQGPAVSLPPAALLAGSPDEAPAPRRLGFEMPGPRAAAVAVLATLA
ncbi:MAG TPA: hypothetical protein VFH80_06305, partial [Solirubrobacteraceae bacterium]|nr:hypothetical protein [Solirubrobacteraceae bacterium]